MNTMTDAAAHAETWRARQASAWRAARSGCALGEKEVVAFGAKPMAADRRPEIRIVAEPPMTAAAKVGSAR